MDTGNTDIYVEIAGVGMAGGYLLGKERFNSAGNDILKLSYWPVQLKVVDKGLCFWLEYL